MTTGCRKDQDHAYDISLFDYDLPEDLIAQNPADRREDSRLLVLDRQTWETAHRRFYELPLILNASDVLVVNDTRVIPARIFGHKSTGGKAEVLVDYADGCTTGTDPYTFECSCMIRASRAPKPGARILFDRGLSGRVISADNGKYRVEFISKAPFHKVLEDIGRVPLPPYIRRPENESDNRDRENYQTVYAARDGAAAAPTAGFHFSGPLIDELREKGIEIITVTLHVSYGTFMPVRVSDIREHEIHKEHYEISPEAAEGINASRRAGRRIVAVGTTSVRTLEYAANEDGTIRPGSGQCDLFIYPGYRYKAVEAMITNFHLPKSTLLMLVSAFAGRKNILAAYNEAIKNRYRFFSYGDAMIIE